MLKAGFVRVFGKDFLGVAFMRYSVGMSECDFYAAARRDFYSEKFSYREFSGGVFLF